MQLIFVLNGDSGLFAGMSDILDPLQIVEPQLPLEEFPAEQGATTPTSRSEQTTAILHWSVEDVRHWLEHNVALPHSRLQGGFNFMNNLFATSLCFLAERIAPSLVNSFFVY